MADVDLVGVAVDDQVVKPARGDRHRELGVVSRGDPALA